jgi:hypothetical protein
MKVMTTSFQCSEIWEIDRAVNSPSGFLCRNFDTPDERRPHASLARPTTYAHLGLNEEDVDFSSHSGRGIWQPSNAIKILVFRSVCERCGRRHNSASKRNPTMALYWPIPPINESAAQ